MPENNQNTEGGTVPVVAPVAPAMPVAPTVQAPLSQQTVSGVMGATRVVNRSAPNVGMYVGIGIISIAIIIAGTYFWVSRVEPGAAVLEEVAETVVPTDAAEIDTLTAEVDSVIDFTEVDTVLDEIDAALQ